MRQASVCLVAIAIGAMLVMKPSLGNIAFVCGSVLWAARCHKKLP